MSLIPTTIPHGLPGPRQDHPAQARADRTARRVKIAVIENEFGEENIDNHILVTDS
ncbi:hypothetical protein GO496_02215 [Acidovorax citrulli]|nr:hypothetical protein [Paracidovorax citrulli]